jgi:riboflavin kinase/FMN adenylyltransferase
LGVDDVITFNFDQDFANLSAQTFLSALRTKLGLRELVVGHDFALGKNRQGTIPVIKEIGQQLSFFVKVIEQIRVDNEDISSTQIRQKLSSGDVAGAAKLLGHWYVVAGKVTHGSDRGSRIGLPTANITHWPKKKLPEVGVYATHSIIDGLEFQGITNVGFRPTFEEQERPNVETHLFDFNRDIYGERIEIQFVQKIREELKFSGVADFLAEIERDKAAARKIFSHVEK